MCLPRDEWIMDGFTRTKELSPIFIKKDFNEIDATLAKLSKTMYAIGSAPSKACRKLQRSSSDLKLEYS